MPEGFLAYIIPVSSGGSPAHPIAPGGGGDIGIWPSPGYPAHPIAPGGPPPGIWPGPGAPSHPIAPGGPPPGIWPGPGGPSQGPGFPTAPIVIPPDAISPGVPSHPIVIPQPPVTIWPGPGIPAHPIAPGGGGEEGSGGTPSHPIAGTERPSTQPLANILVWVPGGGYVMYSPTEGRSSGQMPERPERPPRPEAPAKT